MTLGVSVAPAAFIQRSVGSDLTPISFTVADPAPGTFLEFCITDPAGLGFAPWSGWQVPTPAVTGGTYTSVSIKAPTGGPWTVWVRDKNNTANAYQCPTQFLVGDMRASLGQSLAVGMWADSSSPPSPNTQTKMYNGSWVTPTGNGAITLLNRLVEETGVPQAIIASAVGATSLTYEGYRSFSAQGYGTAGYWMDEANNPFAGFLTSLTNVGGDIAGVIWCQGESDVNHVRAYTYARALSVLWRRILSHVSRIAPEIRFALVETGADFNISNANVAAVIQGQAEFCRLVPGAYRAARHNDLARDTTEVHLTPASYGILGARIAGAIAREEYGV